MCSIQAAAPFRLSSGTDSPTLSRRSLPSAQPAVKRTVAGVWRLRPLSGRILLASVGPPTMLHEGPVHLPGHADVVWDFRAGDWFSYGIPLPGNLSVREDGESTPSGPGTPESCVLPLCSHPKFGSGVKPTLPSSRRSTESRKSVKRTGTLSTMTRIQTRRVSPCGLCYLRKSKSTWACSPGRISKRTVSWGSRRRRRGWPHSRSVECPPVYPCTRISRKSMPMPTPQASTGFVRDGSAAASITLRGSADHLGFLLCHPVNDLS